GKWIGCATSLGNLRRCLERNARETAAGLVQPWRSKALRRGKGDVAHKPPISALVHVMSALPPKRRTSPQRKQMSALGQKRTSASFDRLLADAARVRDQAVRAHGAVSRWKSASSR